MLLLFVFFQYFFVMPLRYTFCFNNLNITCIDSSLIHSIRLSVWLALRRFVYISLLPATTLVFLLAAVEYCAQFLLAKYELPLNVSVDVAIGVDDVDDYGTTTADAEPVAVVVFRSTLRKSEKSIRVLLRTLTEI